MLKVQWKVESVNDLMLKIVRTEGTDLLVLYLLLPVSTIASSQPKTEYTSYLRILLPDPRLAWL